MDHAQSMINFHQCNKVLIKSCIQYYHECWRRRCVGLHNPEVKMKVLKDRVMTIMEGESKEEAQGLKIHVEVDTINVNNM